MNVTGVPSTFPVKNTGIGKAEQLRVIDKMLKGKKLTERQQRVASMFEDEAQVRVDKMSFADDWVMDKGEATDMPAGLLDVGDKVTTPADTYNVVEKNLGMVKFRDGKEVVVGEDQNIPIVKIGGGEELLASPRKGLLTLIRQKQHDPTMKCRWMTFVRHQRAYVGGAPIAASGP